MEVGFRAKKIGLSHSAFCYFILFYFFFFFFFFCIYLFLFYFIFHFILFYFIFYFYFLFIYYFILFLFFFSLTVTRPDFSIAVFFILFFFFFLSLFLARLVSSSFIVLRNCGISCLYSLYFYFSIETIICSCMVVIIMTNVCNKDTVGWFYLNFPTTAWYSHVG